MAYSEELATKIRQVLVTNLPVEEKKMMGGLTFMVDSKMCVGIMKDELMLRVAPERFEELSARKGFRPMDLAGRTMPGYVLADRSVWGIEDSLKASIAVALEFNSLAKASKRKK